MENSSSSSAAPPNLEIPQFLEILSTSPDQAKLGAVKMLSTALVANPAIQLLLGNTDMRKLCCQKNYVLCLPALFESKSNLDSSFFEFHGKFYK